MILLTRRIRALDGFNVEENKSTCQKFPFKQLAIGHRLTFLLGHDKDVLNDIANEISNIPDSVLTPIMERRKFPGHTIGKKMIIQINLKGMKPTTIKDTVVHEFVERKKNFPYEIDKFLPIFVLTNFDTSLSLIQIMDRCEVIGRLTKILPATAEIIIPIMTYEPFEYFRGNSNVEFTSLATGKLMRNVKYLTYRNQMIASKKAYDMLKKKNSKK